MTLNIRICLTGITLLLALAHPAVATPDEDARAGYAAEEKGDYDTAVKLYMNAARGGVGYAMYNIGVLYQNGRGVERSYTQALKWYGDAAKKSHPGAQYALGQMNERGEGMPKNVAEAVKWYRLAGDQGFLPAQNSLGIIYTTGEKGVPADPVQAHFWFTLAAKQDAAAGARRDRVGARLTPQQLEASNKMSAAWKSKAAE